MILTFVNRPNIFWASKPLKSLGRKRGQLQQILGELSSWILLLILAKCCRQKTRSRILNFVSAPASTAVWISRSESQVRPVRRNPRSNMQARRLCWLLQSWRHRKTLSINRQFLQYWRSTRETWQLWKANVNAVPPTPQVRAQQPTNHRTPHHEQACKLKLED